MCHLKQKLHCADAAKLSYFPLLLNNMSAIEGKKKTENIQEEIARVKNAAEKKKLEKAEQDKGMK